jgi:hypothetical protein
MFCRISVATDCVNGCVEVLQLEERVIMLLHELCDRIS